MNNSIRLIQALLIAGIILSTSLFAQNPGWVKGDFHQHTTFTDGSYSFFHVMAKNFKFGLDWWANSEHGGGFNRNGMTSGPDLGNVTNYWDSYSYTILGTASVSGGHQNMWRWQSLKDVSFNGVLTVRNLYPTSVIFQGYEWNAPGHEHVSMGCFPEQFKKSPNADAIAEFEFKFDNSDGDLTGGVAQGWTKSTNTGHAKTLEAVEWLQDEYPNTSWIVPAHPERKVLWKIEHFRDMSNSAPDVCMGFESMPGHQKESSRGSYNNSSYGGGSFGGTGIFAAKVGGVWDAMLSEGRNWWLFASSDFHSEDADFYPGEYQKTYTYVKDTENPYAIANGLRSGNSWIVEGDLIDNLDFRVETAKMGETYNFKKKNNEVYIYIKIHDPQGNNNNTYSEYKNPTLNHIDVIAGKVGNKIDPNHPDYTKDNVSTTSVIARFDATGGVVDGNGIVSKKWNDLGDGWKEMTIFVEVDNSMYFRLRGTNHGLNVTNETDINGNPLSDNLLAPNNATKAFADLWFYSNPIFLKYLNNNHHEKRDKDYCCFNFSPNPAKNNIKFRTEESGDLQITDMMGNMVGKYCVPEGEIEIDISKWGHGNYVFTFFNGEETFSKNLKVQR